MNLYKCPCGAALDVDDGKLCVACFVTEHAKKPEPTSNAETLNAWLRDPSVSDFFESVKKEIVFQKAAWVELDKMKTPAHWFWLVAHLSSKAMNSLTLAKREHHIVTAAACLYLWLESLRGAA